METPIPTIEENAEARRYSGTTIFHAVVATLVVVLAVAKHWNGFGLFDKFIAMLLIFNLVVGPPLGKRLLKRSKGENTADIVALSAYIALMMATVLFAK